VNGWSPLAPGGHAAIGIVVLSVVLGPAAMMALSLAQGTFWIGSEIDLPMVLHFSVTIGDLVFLSWFNVFGVPRLLFLASRMSPASVVASALTSLGAIGALHWFWTYDGYSTFMDREQGALTPAGWWHMGYAWIEFMIVGAFVASLLAPPRDQASTGPLERWARESRMGLGLLVAYALVSVPDAIAKLVILEGSRPTVAFGFDHSDLVNLAKIALALGLLVTFQRAWGSVLGREGSHDAR
jgi:hypothetical protein